MSKRSDRRTFLAGVLGACGAAWLGRAALGSDQEGEGTMEPADDRTVVGRTWRRIESWMASHASEVLGLLRAGASAEDIRQLENLVGPMPAPFRSSLARHDGQEWGPSVVGYAMLMPVADIAETWALSRKFSAGAERPWRRGWVPFAGPGDGDYLFLSLDSMDGHRPGTVWRFRHDDEPMVSAVAPSYEAWLEKWAEELEAGVFEVERSRLGAGLMPRLDRESQTWAE